LRERRPKVEISTTLEFNMLPQRIVGVVLLLVGLVLLGIGMNSSHSVADQVSNTFTGRFTRETVGYMIGGGVAALAGLFMVLFAGRRRSI
jgi:drug/metabolite transporter (DMT)-like permease